MNNHTFSPWAEVEYIESGTFQGGEEDVFLAGIKRGQECIAMSKEYFEALQDVVRAAGLLRVDNKGRTIAQANESMDTALDELGALMRRESE